MKAFDRAYVVRYNDGVFAFARQWLGTKPIDGSRATVSNAHGGASLTLDAVGYSMRSDRGEVQILDDASLKVEAGEFL